MKIIDPHYRTMRPLKNDPRLPLIAMSTFDHFTKATLSSPMISLTIPLATTNSNHFGMALTSSNIASPKVHTSWPPPKASRSKNPSMGYTSINFMLKFSQAALGSFSFLAFLIFFRPHLKLSFVLLTDDSSTSLPHWLRRRRQPLDTKSRFDCLGSLHPFTRNATFQRHLFRTSNQ
jgi:hypothetical protein